MAVKSKDYNDGYQAAIAAIKQSLSNSGNSGGGGEGSDLSLPQSQNQGSSNGGSRTDSSNPDQGIVRPEDCAGENTGELSQSPETPGGMIDRAVGDKIAAAEGYPDDGPSEKSMENEWKDTALKSVSKMKGSSAGGYISKIEGLYKVSTDWKKILRKIVGYSISPDEKRQAYANKNVLVSQDRIARTDKDKYDNLDYMMAWIDSSGSMSDEQLQMCLSEVYSVALQKKPLKLIVIQCDTKIQEIKEYTDVRSMKRDFKHATVKGRGGTELRPCWDLLKNDKKYKGRQAELVMIFTDGHLNQYKRDPRTMKNLCWCIIDNPSFNVQHKDVNTKAIFLNSKDIK